VSYVTSVVIADRCQITLFIQSIVIFRRSGLTIPAHIRLWSVDDAAERCGWSINDDSVSRTSNFISCSNCEHKQQRIRSRHCIESDKLAYLITLTFAQLCLILVLDAVALVASRQRLRSTTRRSYSSTAPPAQLLWPTGFMCGWTVSLEFPAGQLAGSGYLREQFQTISEDVSVRNVLMHSAHYVSRLYKSTFYLHTYILTYLSSPRLLVVSTFATVKAGLITKCCGRGPHSVRSSNN